ncbi:MAG: hypothetical protein ABIJ91_05200 [Candidatus Kuenenbacteria bacterium]
MEYKDEVRRMLEKTKVFWLYSGEPRKNIPHALLASGKHSDGYVNVGDAIKNDAETRWLFAKMLLETLKGVCEEKFDWVVGADTSSTALALDVAKLAGAGHIRMIKDVYDGKSHQVWSCDNALSAGGGKILHIEELITTAFSAIQVQKEIMFELSQNKKGAQFVSFLPVIVDRSDPDNRVSKVENSLVLPLLRLRIKNYNKDECPYCKAGSIAIKPKEGDNWARLVGS